MLTRAAAVVLATLLTGAGLAAPVSVAPAQAAAAGGDTLIWPVTDIVTSLCGPRGGKIHQGLDLGANHENVLAAYGGTASVKSDPAGYGQYVDIQHANGYLTRYAHLVTVNVANGAAVAKGAVIGVSGGGTHTMPNGQTYRDFGSGNSTGHHLHFELRRYGVHMCDINTGVTIGTAVTAGTPMPVVVDLGGGGSYEPVVNGGGVHITGTTSYTDVSSGGHVYAWNGNYHGGNPPGYSGRFVDAKVMAGQAGYWLLTSAGQIYAYDAPYLGGSPTGFSGEIVAMAATPDATGYVMVSSYGQVYAYGTPYRGGSPSGYSGQFVDVEMTADGGGYWLLTSAGQIYAYGNAQYLGGSPTGFDRAIVAMSPTPDSGGYVLVSKTGQVYAYGNSQYMGGSPTGVTGEISDISYRLDQTPGYVMISTSGQHYAYNTGFYGNPSLEGFIF